MEIFHLKNCDEFREYIETSSRQPLFLFKHSTRCPISFNAEREFLKFAAETPDSTNIIFLHLDLLKYRDVSDTIEEILAVRHQSPQVILVKNKKACWSISHSNISMASLNQAVAQFSL